MPGQVNTVSVTSAPPSRVGICNPASVIIGISALRMAWRSRICRSGRPLARAVRMKSWLITSSMEARM